VPPVIFFYFLFSFKFCVKLYIFFNILVFFLILVFLKIFVVNFSYFLNELIFFLKIEGNRKPKIEVHWLPRFCPYQPPVLLAAPSFSNVIIYTRCYILTCPEDFKRRGRTCGFCVFSGKAHSVYWNGGTGSAVLTKRGLQLHPCW